MQKYNCQHFYVGVKIFYLTPKCIVVIIIRCCLLWFSLSFYIA